MKGLSTPLIGTTHGALGISLLLIFTVLNDIERLHILKVILHMVWNISASQIVSNALTMPALQTQFLILPMLTTHVLKMSQYFSLGHFYNTRQHLSDVHSNASYLGDVCSTNVRFVCNNMMAVQFRHQT